MFVMTLASCAEDKNHLAPYSPPLTAKQKGDEAMKSAAKTDDDTLLLELFAEARSQYELALTEEPDQVDAISPLLATALAGLAGLPFYRVLLNGLASGNLDPESLATDVLPSEPSQAQVDLLNGAVQRLMEMSVGAKDTGIKFQTTFYSVLAIRMTLTLVQNTTPDISEISPENAEAILDNLDAIIATGLEGEQKEQFEQIKAELDTFGGEDATSAEKLAAYCVANPTSEICGG